MLRYLSGMMLVFTTLSSHGQKPDPLVRKPDSLSHKTDNGDQQITNTAPSAYNQATRITPGSYFILLWSDIKQAYTKAFHMKGRDWRVAGEFALAAGAAAFTDVRCSAALGYVTRRLTAKNHHRYAQLKKPETRKVSVALNVQYHFGRLMPGVAYTFR